MNPPDEKWRNGHTGEPYWRPSTEGEARTEWVVIHGQDAPTAAQEAPGRPGPPTADAAATPPPEPIPVSRAQRLRNLMAAVRNGDHSAADLLRAAIGGNDVDP